MRASGGGAGMAEKMEMERKKEKKWDEKERNAQITEKRYTYNCCIGCCLKAFLVCFRRVLSWCAVGSTQRGGAYACGSLSGEERERKTGKGRAIAFDVRSFSSSSSSSSLRSFAHTHQI